MISGLTNASRQPQSSWLSPAWLAHMPMCVRCSKVYLEHNAPAEHFVHATYAMIFYKLGHAQTLSHCVGVPGVHHVQTQCSMQQVHSSRQQRHKTLQYVHVQLPCSVNSIHHCQASGILINLTQRWSTLSCILVMSLCKA